MKRKLTTVLKSTLAAVLLTLPGVGLQAQVVNNTESFDGTTFVPTGWTYVGTAGWWSRQTTGTSPTCSPRSGAGFARFNSFNITSGSAYMVTPAFDLANRGGNTPTVSFWMYRDGGYNTATYDLEGVTVYINTSATTAGATSLGYIPRRIGLAPIVGANGWYQYSFNIPASFSGATNYIIFYANSQYGNNIFIDDLAWQAYPTNRNIGVTQIVNPVNNGCGNPADTLKVRVDNFSIFTASNFNVVANITGTINGSAVNTTISTTYAGTLGAGANVTIPVGALGNLANSANLNIRAYTSYANDLTKTNDTTNQTGIVVNKRPYGSQFNTSLPFKGTLSQGTMGSPDIVKSADTAIYDVTAPTGYTLAGYGTTWQVQSATLKSMTNVSLPGSSISVTGSSGSLKLGIVPPAGYTDSMVRMDMVLYDISTNCTFSYTRYIFVAPVPRVKFTFGPACAGQGVVFENTSTISTGSMNFIWDYGDASQPNSGGQTRVYNATGTYNIKLTAISNLNISKDTTITVTVHANPVVDFVSINACEGSPVQFSNQTNIAGGEPLNFTWNYGDGGTSNAANPTHTYTQSGVYNVSLTATSGFGCTDTKIRPAIQYAKPIAGFTSVGTCSNKAVVFTNTTTLSIGTVGYKWVFGDGSTSTEINPQHAFSTSGSQNIKLIATSGTGCSDSVSHILNLTSGPLVSFTTSERCAARPMQFTNTSTGLSGASYRWDFGNGDTSALENPSQQFASAGNHTVSLTVTNADGCSNTKTEEVYLKVQPLADFNLFEDTLCSGDQLVFLNSTDKNGTVVTYKWEFGDGATSTEVNPHHKFVASANTTYPVKLIAYAAQGCSDSVTRDLYVSKLPSCDFNITTMNTGQREYTFTVLETGNNVKWFFDDGKQASGSTVNHKYANDNIYKVRVTSVNAAGCECQAMQTLTVIKMGTGKEALAGTVLLYPNPSSGTFTVKLDGQAKVDYIGIYNILGELVQTVDLKSGVTTYTVDLSDQPSGIYLVKARAGDDMITRKITIAR